MTVEEEIHQKAIANLDLVQGALSSCLRSITEDIEILRRNGADAYMYDTVQKIGMSAGLFKIQMKDVLDKVRQIGTDITSGANDECRKRG